MRKGILLGFIIPPDSHPRGLRAVEGGEERVVRLGPRHARYLEELSRSQGEEPGRVLEKLIEERIHHLEERHKRAGGSLGEVIERGLEEGSTVSHDVDHMLYLGAGASGAPEGPEEEHEPDQGEE